MVWDVFVTGHMDVYQAPNGFVTGSISYQRFEAFMRKQDNSRVQDIFHSLEEKKTKASEKFLQENPHKAQKMLFKAAVAGDEIVIAYLINAGHGLHFASDPTIMPLHAASYNGRLVVAKQLINAGVDVNHLDEFGGTPLMCAVASSHTEILKCLLQNCADAKFRETRTGGSSALELELRNAKNRSSAARQRNAMEPYCFHNRRALRRARIYIDHDGRGRARDTRFCGFSTKESE
jgi:ankyrin repeat protein